jgi:hypothetical protein
VYDSYIVKNGCLQFGQSNVGYLPTELYRNPGVGFGIDQLFTRRVFAMHALGTEALSGSVGGVSPTDAELALAANINRVFETENMGIVVVRHKIA